MFFTLKKESSLIVSQEILSTSHLFQCRYGELSNPGFGVDKENESD